MQAQAQIHGLKNEYLKNNYHSWSKPILVLKSNGSNNVNKTHETCKAMSADFVCGSCAVVFNSVDILEV